MKKNFSLLGFVLMTCISITFAQEPSSLNEDFNFRSEYKKVVTLFEEENYKDAIFPLKELQKQQMDNDNVRYLIGFCYLETHIDKAKSIPYFEDILSREDNLVIGWDYINHREKKAPLNVIKYLGEAYHFDYQFDKAIENYEEYKSFLNSDFNEEIAEINKKIEVSKFAKQLVDNPVDINVKNLGEKINSKYPDYAPVVTADEQEIFFTTRRKGVKGKQNIDGKFFEDIYTSKKAGDSWVNALPISDSINTDKHEATMSISADGQEMLLYKNEENGGGIYLSELSGSDWSTPSKIGSDINSDAWESHANFSADRRLIYFTSERKGGKGGRDIFFAKRAPTDKNWALSQTTGLELINTKYDEESPFLHPDGKTLYFSSKGHQTMGGFDIFVSTFDDSLKRWSKPENIGYPINTTGDDVFYIPSTDGKRAYFSSERESGFGGQDIYVMSFTNAKEKNLTVYKGLVKDYAGDIPSNLMISVKDPKTKELLGRYKPNVETGKYLLILPEDSDYQIDFKPNNNQKRKLISYIDL